MNANSTYIRVLASALSNQYGVKVIEGDTWAFNMEKKMLMYCPATLLDKPIEIVRGLLIHEIGHILHTQPVPSSDIYKKYPVINYIYNSFEDIRIEAQLRVMFGDYAGFSLSRKNLLYTGDFFKDNALKGISKSAQVGAIAQMVELMEQIYHHEIMAANMNESDLFRTITTVEKNLDKYVDEDVHEAAQIIQKKEDWTNLVATARRLKSFGEIQKMVDTRIFPYIEHLLQQDPQNEQMQQAMAQGEMSEEQAQATSSEMLDEPGNGNVAIEMIPSKLPPYTEVSAMIAPETSYLASRIKDILKENAAIKFHGNHHSGKLLSRNITRLTLGEDRVFSKRNQVDSPRYHLYLAIDGSGSMDGDKIYNAYLGAIIAFDTFKKIRMPATVVEFSNEVKLLADVNYINPKFLQFDSQGGGTDDRSMIIHAANYMRKHPDEDFLFLIIGDGCGYELPQNDVKYITERSVAMALGIGDGAEEVSRAYPGGIAIDDVKQVPSTILHTLHNYIHR